MNLKDFRSILMLEHLYEKLKFVLLYFHTMFSKEISKRKIYFIRNVSNTEELSKTILNSKHKLRDVKIVHDKLIEDFPNCDMADFANQYIGGGALTQGCL